jgi:hypothetical protein
MACREAGIRPPRLVVELFIMMKLDNVTLCCYFNLEFRNCVFMPDWTGFFINRCVPVSVVP